MSGLVGVWPAHLLDFCHPVLRINAGDSLLLSKSVALLDLISEDWSSILQPLCVSQHEFEDKTPILAGAVDICSCQNFFSLLWFLFCLLRPLVSSLSKSLAGLKNSIQVTLFFHFTSYYFLRLELYSPTSDTFWVWIGKLYSNVDFLRNAFTRYSLVCVDFFFVFLRPKNHFLAGLAGL